MFFVNLLFNFQSFEFQSLLPRFREYLFDIRNVFYDSIASSVSEHWTGQKQIIIRFTLWIRIQTHCVRHHIYFLRSSVCYRIRCSDCVSICVCVCFDSIKEQISLWFFFNLYIHLFYVFHPIVLFCIACAHLWIIWHNSFVKLSVGIYISFRVQKNRSEKCVQVERESVLWSIKQFWWRFCVRDLYHKPLNF